MRVFYAFIFFYFFTGVTCACAQQMSFHLLNKTRFLEDGTVAVLPAAEQGIQLMYDGPLPWLLLDYNAGAEYNYNFETGAQEIFLITGIRKVFLAPYSFTKARNAESVGYGKNKLLIGVDINFLNGCRITEQNFLYVFAADPAFNIGFQVGKKKNYIITAGIGPRFTWCPKDINGASYVDGVLKLGLRKLARR